MKEFLKPKGGILMYKKYSVTIKNPEAEKSWDKIFGIKGRDKSKKEVKGWRASLPSASDS